MTEKNRVDVLSSDIYNYHSLFYYHQTSGPPLLGFSPTTG